MSINESIKLFINSESETHEVKLLQSANYTNTSAVRVTAELTKATGGS